MIEKVMAFKIGEQMFNSFEEAQRHELEQFLKAVTIPDDTSEMVKELAGHILAGKTQVMDILTMSPRARAKARRINGATKRRTAKPAVAPPVAA